jgi:hypothetical protein
MCVSLHADTLAASDGFDAVVKVEANGVAGMLLVNWLAGRRSPAYPYALGKDADPDRYPDRLGARVSSGCAARHVCTLVPEVVADAAGVAEVEGLCISHTV